MGQGCLGYCLCCALPTIVCRGIHDHRETRPKRAASETVAFARAWQCPGPRVAKGRFVRQPNAGLVTSCGAPPESRLPMPRMPEGEKPCRVCLR